MSDAEESVFIEELVGHIWSVLELKHLIGEARTPWKEKEDSHEETLREKISERLQRVFMNCKRSQKESREKGGFFSLNRLFFNSTK